MSKIDILLAILINIIWSSSLAFSGYALKFYSPIFAYEVRFLLIGLLTIPFYRLPKKYLPNLLLLSLLQSVIFFGVALGIKNLDSSTTAILTRLDILFTIVLGRLVFKESLSGRIFFGIIMCFTGIYIISGNIDISNIKYVLLLIATCVASAIANILVKTIRDTKDINIVTWVTFFTGIELSVVSFLTEDKFILQPLQFKSVFVLVYLGVVSSYLTYIGLYYLLRKYKTSQVMPYNFLKPVLAIIFGYLILGEPITCRKFVGALLIMAGISVTQPNFIKMFRLRRMYRIMKYYRRRFIRRLKYYKNKLGTI